MAPSIELDSQGTGKVFGKVMRNRSRSTIHI